jgi:hypothetical protein
METKTFDKQEYNKLCAEFLGAEHSLSFDTDWNLIHNIVAQIESLEEGVDVEHNWYVTIGEGAYCRIFTNEFKTFQDEIIVNGDTKKQSAVLAIWEFLNYYNEIKK